MKKYNKPIFYFIFIFIIWDALKVYLHLNAPIIQFIALFSPFILVLVKNDMNKLFSVMFTKKPYVIWFIWIIYSLINTLIINGYHNHSNQNILVFISSIILPLFFMLFVSISKEDTLKILNVLIFSFFIRMLLSYIFDSMASLGNDDIARLGADFNANSIGIGALMICVLIAIKKIQYNSFSIYEFTMLIMSIFTIFLASSKKTFLALVVLAAGYILITSKKNTILNFVRILFFSVIGYFSFVYVLDNTSLGARLTHSYNKTLEADSSNKMFDNRVNQYIGGWEVFKENPINGIGLSNYEYETGETRLHTEYMIQLTECGLIGSFLFLSFYYNIISSLLIKKKNKIAKIYFLGVLIMLILFLGSWNFNIIINWVLISLAIRYNLYGYEKR